jgi:hypothetical protein
MYPSVMGSPVVKDGRSRVYIGDFPIHSIVEANPPEGSPQSTAPQVDALSDARGYLLWGGGVSQDEGREYRSGSA